MAVDVTLTTITTGYNLSKLNANFAAIATALADGVSRSGNSPNTMTDSLDMNSEKIINLADAVNNGDAVSKSFGDARYDTAGSDTVAAAASAAAALVSEDAAAASVLEINLPLDANVDALEYLRRNSGDDGYEARSPTEVRGDLSLGTAALKNVGTSGDTIPKNDTINVFSERLRIVDDSAQPLLILDGKGGEGLQNDQLRLIPHPDNDGEKTTISFRDESGVTTRAVLVCHDDTGGIPENHFSIETVKLDGTTVVTRLDVKWGVDISTIGIKNANLEIFSIGNPQTEGLFKWSALNTTPARVNFGILRLNVLDNTAATEDAEWQWTLLVDGSFVTVMRIGRGIQCGIPTGGDKGLGSLNATAVYDDGTILTPYVFEADKTGTIDLAALDDKVPNTEIPAELDDEGKVQRGPRTEIRTHAPAARFLGRAASDLDPDTYTKSWKDNGHLPALPSEEEWVREGNFSLGDLMQRLMETCEVQAVHIGKLSDRIKLLEGN